MRAPMPAFPHNPNILQEARVRPETKDNTSARDLADGDGVAGAGHKTVTETVEVAERRDPLGRKAQRQRRPDRKRRSNRPIGVG